MLQKNRNSTGPPDTTPPECWKGGIIYYNPDDPVLFVAGRDGAGFTLNMANRWSWACFSGPLLIVAVALLIMR